MDRVKVSELRGFIMTFWEIIRVFIVSMFLCVVALLGANYIVIALAKLLMAMGY